MRKIYSFALAFGLSFPTFAGGLLTNTNQNIAFLRNPSRDAAIGIDGVYSNPAGLSFMNKGWHLSLNIQGAFQTRTVNSTYMINGIPPFAMGEGNSSDGWKKFEGKASAPVVPSFQMAWVGKRWSFSGGLAVVGGGGKATFDNGLGSFESQIAALPTIFNVISGKNLVEGYSADMYMKGRQYYYGLQVGGGYKITPHLSAYVGGRLVLADCNYYGYVKNIKLKVKNQYIPAAQLLNSIGMGNLATAVSDKGLDCDQSGWTFMPIVSLNYKIQKWNFAARYEFSGKMHLKNISNNTTGVAEFDDGRKNWAEMPALFTAGIQYSILPSLRVSAGYHHFFDKQAKQYDSREKKLKNGTNEYLAGIEYDINKRATISAGWQSTNYGLGKNSEFLSDISFVTSSNSIGLGAEIHITPKISMNVAYFKTFYKKYTKHMDDYDNLKGSLAAMVGNSDLPEANKQQLGKMLGQFKTPGSDTFDRTNDVYGIGINFDF